MTRCSIYLLFSICCTLSACNTAVSFNKQEETAAILHLLLQERKAHFSKDAALFVSGFADTVFSVNRGKLTIRTRAENLQRFDPYFRGTDFISWDDRESPLIRFSNDGSLAYAIVQKRVIVDNRDSAGKAYPDTTDYAWTSIYRKQEGGWKLECNSSTQK